MWRAAFERADFGQKWESRKADGTLFSEESYAFFLLINPLKKEFLIP
jgi:hypothetical protein